MTLDYAKCCTAACHGNAPKTSKTKDLCKEIQTLHSASKFITLGHLRPCQMFMSKNVHPFGATIYQRLFEKPSNILLWHICYVETNTQAYYTTLYIVAVKTLHMNHELLEIVL
jgi:hypothetical protein